MSKRKGAAKKRRRKRKPPKTPRANLRALAAALNACENAGMKMHAGAGAVFADPGVVLRLKGGKWEARMFTLTPDAPAGQPDDLDD